MLKKAMIYPIVVCIVAVIVTIVMLVKVIPSYEDMFADLGTDLPWITKFYVAMSHGIQNYWFIIIPVIIAAAIGIKYFAGTNPGKHVFGKIALKLPILKTYREVGSRYDGKNFEYTDGCRCSVD